MARQGIARQGAGQAALASAGSTAGGGGPPAGEATSALDLVARGLRNMLSTYSEKAMRLDGGGALTAPGSPAAAKAGGAGTPAAGASPLASVVIVSPQATAGGAPEGGDSGGVGSRPERLLSRQPTASIVMSRSFTSKRMSALISGVQVRPCPPHDPT